MTITGPSASRPFQLGAKRRRAVLGAEIMRAQGVVISTTPGAKRGGKTASG